MTPEKIEEIVRKNSTAELSDETWKQFDWEAIAAEVSIMQHVLEIRAGVPLAGASRVCVHCGWPWSPPQLGGRVRHGWRGWRWLKRALGR